MKKNLLFFIPMILIAVALCLVEVTKMPVHIALSVVGLVVLVAYTLVTKKEWKCPVLEILERVCYGIALITGVVLMNVHGIVAVFYAHRISAILFVVLFVVCEIHKLIKK